MATVANDLNSIPAKSIEPNKGLISGSLGVWRPAHTDFLIGHDDKATHPLTDRFPQKYLFQSFHEP
jgi:hypothetical protein